jgi:hypothetical protein
MAGGAGGGSIEPPWSRINGNFFTTRQTVRGLAIGPNGDVVITGGYQGQGAFGGTVSTATGFDFYLARYKADGTYLRHEVGNSANAEGRALAIDSQGQVRLLVHVSPVGSTTTTATFGGTSVNAEFQHDVTAIANHRPDAGFVWMHFAKTINSGVPAEMNLSAIAISPLDQSSVTVGKMRSMWGYDDPNPSGANGTNGNWLLIRNSVAGAVPWLKQSVCTGGLDDLKAPESVAIDAVGGTYVLGELGTKSCVFDGITPSNADDLSMVKLDDAGTFIAAKRFASWSPGSPATGALATKNGVVWIAQTFINTINPAGVALSSAGGTDILLARVVPGDLNIDIGSEVVIGGSGDEQVRGLALDSDGGIWLATETSAGLTAPAGTPPGVVLIRFTAPTSGAPAVLDIRNLTSTGTNTLRGLGLSALGSPIVTGETTPGSSVDLGTGALVLDAGVYLGRIAP